MQEVTMEFRALHMLLWLLAAVSLTTQELAKLSVSPSTTAECGKQVTLNCNVFSSRKQLSIKHMEWSLSGKALCTVGGEEDVTEHHGSDFPKSFSCEYIHGNLSLTLLNVTPLDRGRYMCKLQANQGADHKHTQVELQECCGSVESTTSSDGQVCTFKQVYPDGDVHWFHGSHNVSHGSLKHNIMKSVDSEGWLIIESHLETKSSDKRYSCSLMSTKSGRYIARSPVAKSSPRWFTSGAGSQAQAWTFLCISVLLSVTLAEKTD